MRRVSLLAVTMLALVASGCFEGSSSKKTVHIQTARDHKAAMQLERMPIPPFHGHPLVNVTCRVSGKMATCDGQTEDGQWLRNLQFRFDSHGEMEPVCEREGEGRLPNIFCAV
jgi:hypothetical protein